MDELSDDSEAWLRPRGELPDVRVHGHPEVKRETFGRSDNWIGSADVRAPSADQYTYI